MERRTLTIIFPGQEHGFFNYNHYTKAVLKDPDALCYYRITLNAHMDFLRSLGWIE